MLQRLVVTPAQFNGELIQLTSEQQHYLCRVLRLSSGDRFLAMDGQGHTWLAQLGGDQFLATLLEPVTTQSELPVAVTLVMALPKGSGFDDIVRQATELGVNHIIPVISDRTLLQPSANKLDRWRRIAQEAAEQSERQVVPTIAEPISFTEHLRQVNESSSTKFLCVTRQNCPHLVVSLNDTIGAEQKNYPSEPTPDLPPDLLSEKNIGQPSPILLAIGPEGGWTDAEVEAAIAAGYQPVSLGSRILRAVTAPVTALSLIAAVFETKYSF